MSNLRRGRKGKANWSVASLVTLWSAFNAIKVLGQTLKNIVWFIFLILTYLHLIGIYIICVRPGRGMKELKEVIKSKLQAGAGLGGPLDR